MNRGSTATTKNRALPFLKNQLHLLHFSATMEKTQEVFYYGQAYHSLAAQGRAFCRRKGRDQGEHQNRAGGPGRADPGPCGGACEHQRPALFQRRPDAGHHLYRCRCPQGLLHPPRPCGCGRWQGAPLHQDPCLPGF